VYVKRNKKRIGQKMCRKEGEIENIIKSRIDKERRKGFFQGKGTKRLPMAKTGPCFSLKS